MKIPGDSRWAQLRRVILLSFHKLQPIPEIMAVYFTRDRLYVKLSGEQYIYQIEPRAT